MSSITEKSGRDGAASAGPTMDSYRGGAVGQKRVTGRARNRFAGMAFIVFITVALLTIIGLAATAIANYEQINGNLKALESAYTGMVMESPGLVTAPIAGRDVEPTDMEDDCIESTSATTNSAGNANSSFPTGTTTGITPNGTFSEPGISASSGGAVNSITTFPASMQITPTPISSSMSTPEFASASSLGATSPGNTTAASETASTLTSWVTVTRTISLAMSTDAVSGVLSSSTSGLCTVVEQTVTVVVTVSPLPLLPTSTISTTSVVTTVTTLVTGTSTRVETVTLTITPVTTQPTTSSSPTASVTAIQLSTVSTVTITITIPGETSAMPPLTANTTANTTSTTVATGNVTMMATGGSLGTSSALAVGFNSTYSVPAPTTALGPTSGGKGSGGSGAYCVVMLTTMALIIAIAL